MNSYDLPNSDIVVIQGKIKKGTFKLPSMIKWVDWKQDSLLKKQTFTGSLMQNFLLQLSKFKIISNEVNHILQTALNYRDVTETYFEQIPPYFDSLQTYDTLFEIMELYLERTNLEEELKWAMALETKSKANVGIKRITSLDKEIEELENALRVIQPQYEFMKKKEENHQHLLHEINITIKIINKSYMTKTSQINKFKRKIDAENPKFEIYSDKIEELEDILPKNELSKNSDYTRLTKKLDSVSAKIQDCEENIASLSHDMLEDKDKLKKNKTRLTKIKRDYGQSEQKFTKIKNSYENVSKGLKEKKTEKDRLIHDQVQNLSSLSDQTPPDNIRFSSIIEKEFQSNSTRLSKFFDISNDSPVEYIKDFLSRVNKNPPKIEFHEEIQSNMLKNQIKKFSIILSSIENSMNLLLEAAHIQIILSKLPLVKEGENLIPSYGMRFDIMRNNKLTPFEKLTGEDRIVVMWSFECALNQLAGLTTHVFSDSNYKIKRTKKMLQNILQYVNKHFISKYPGHKFIILLNKPILEDVTQKNLIITTI